MPTLEFRVNVPERAYRSTWRQRNAPAYMLVVVALAAFMLASGISVTPARVSFFAMAIGGIQTQHVDITNRGPGLRRVDSVQFDGGDKAVFGSEPGQCSSINAGDTCLLEIRYRPGSPGTHRATLLVTDSDGLEHNIGLTGTATTNGKLTTTPTLLQFDEVRVGEMQMHSFQITGNEMFAISYVKLTGKNREDFRSDNSDCKAHTTAPSYSCQISVTFKPTAAGDRRAALELADNMTGQQYSIDLIGKGLPKITVNSANTPEPEIDVNPSVLDFSQPNVPHQSLLVTNRGNAPLRTQVSVQGNDPERFQVDATECETVDVSKDCKVEVSYKPRLFGGSNFASAQLQIRHNVPNVINPRIVTLTWARKETPRFQVTTMPRELRFILPSMIYERRVVPDNFETRQIIVRNEAGSPPLTQLNLRLGFIGQDTNGPFRYTTNCHEHLDAGDECIVQVSFAPKNVKDIGETSTLYVFDGRFNAVAKIPLSSGGN